MEAARKQQEVVGFWPIPEMARGMRVEHERLAQLGWVYDGFGGYRKKAASSQPAPKLAASNVQVNGRFRPSNQLSLFVAVGGFDAP
ncbi:MAG: hypothetical protein ACJ8EK_19710 [Bradyrhizobium sp.]|jgi:hypothetical protein